MGIFEEERRAVRSKPMKISRNLLGAFRSALASTLVVGGSLMMSPEARADGWEVSYRIDGVADSSSYGSAPWSQPQGQGNYDPITGRTTPNNNSIGLDLPVGSAQSLVEYGSLSNYRATSASMKGNVTVYLKWVQNPPTQNEDGSYSPVIPVPKMVLLLIGGGATADAFAPTSQSTVKTTFGLILGTETSGPSNDGFNRASGASPPSGTIVVPLTVPDGETELEYTFSIEAKATTQTMQVPPYADQALTPTSRTATRFNADLSGLALMPSPDNIALDDGSRLADGTTPAKGLNQYVISNVMPTSISWNKEDTTIAEWFKDKVSWNLVGTAPALRPVAQVLTSPSSVAPGHMPLPAMSTPPPGPSPTPYPGFEFAVRTRSYPAPSGTSSDGWNFPADNSSFGVKTFNHVVDGTIVPAPVALFYPSNDFQHPSGGIPGHAVNTGFVVGFIDTPNWFYYYSKAWLAPSPIAYWDRDYSEFNPALAQVHIGSPAHGQSYGKRPLFEIRSGVMMWVGSYQCYGIDAFARVVTHECKHKEVYEMYNQSISDARSNNIPDDAMDSDGKMMDPNADADGDSLPNILEESLGLSPLEADSTGFNSQWYGGDSEAIARWAENQIGTSPNRMVDWADDGLNYGTTPGGDPQNRIKRYKRDDVTLLP